MPTEIHNPWVESPETRFLIPYPKRRIHGALRHPPIKFTPVDPRVMDALSRVTPLSPNKVDVITPVNSTSEHLLLDDTHTTARPSDWVFKLIHLLEPIPGKRIIEVCSGFSTSCMKLREQGAMAIAIDYRYKDLHRMVNSLQHYFDKKYQLKDTNPNEYEVEIASAVSFIENIPKSGGQNVAALAGSLPFQNGVFDDGFSFNGLSLLVANPDVFLSLIKEGLRVLKPGRIFQVAPFSPFGHELIPSDPEGQRQRQLLDRLTEEGIPFHYVPYQDVAYQDGFGTLLLYRQQHLTVLTP